MDDLDISELESIDTTLPEINLEGMMSMDEVHTALSRHLTPAEIKAAQNANHTSTSEKISIRIPHHILALLKLQAEETGMAYQTFINLILAEFAAGRLSFLPPS